MRQALGISAFAVGLALAGSTGCTRTSDGSIVMRKPVMFNNFLGLRANRAEIAELNTNPPVPAYLDDVAPVSPAAPAGQAKVSMPTMSVARNPPFKRTDPGKPLSCHNESTKTGRIRIVCI